MGAGGASEGRPRAGRQVVASRRVGRLVGGSPIGGLRPLALPQSIRARSGRSRHPLPSGPLPAGRQGSASVLVALWSVVLTMLAAGAIALTSALAAREAVSAAADLAALAGASATLRTRPGMQPGRRSPVRTGHGSPGAVSGAPGCGCRTGPCPAAGAVARSRWGTHLVRVRTPS